MKMSELYDKIPSPSRNLYSVINQYLLGNLWTIGSPAPVSASELTGLSNGMWAKTFDRDTSVTLDVAYTIYNIDIENITAAQVQSLMTMLFMPYKDKWIKLFNNVFKQSYNPIWNVDGEESTVRTYEYGKKNTETKDFTIEHGRDSTDTETVTDNITDNDVYGFNSSSPVGASKSTNNGERETVYSGADTDTHSGTDSFQESGVDTERITNTRGGNIGVTSTQNMLEQELALRKKFNYFAIVTKDIIRELTMNVY